MIIIIGASASGKTEISKILQSKYNYNKCVTTTTRLIRDNEINHIDYHFLTIKEFLKKIEDDEFVEYEIYNDNYYGINKKDVGNNSLVIVEPNGANTLIDKFYKESFVVYIETNESIRRQRMIDRGDNILDIEQRLLNDKNVFKKENITKIDLVITNNDHEIEELAKLIYLAYKNRF